MTLLEITQILEQDGFIGFTRLLHQCGEASFWSLKNRHFFQSMFGYFTPLLVSSAEKLQEMRGMKDGRQQRSSGGFWWFTISALIPQSAQLIFQNI